MWREDGDMGARRKNGGSFIHADGWVGVPHGGVLATWTMGHLLTGHLVILKYWGEDVHFSKPVFRNGLNFGMH